ncbi:MAG: hypothetical protein JOZ68_02810 [Acidimicrobiia bacterium]|nr:hypothetical protein [Acidimicrobiia bacterium]MBV8986682.1 hypothetical protein [Acidimicrobiia bacterium]MBV9039904.1 hypothetical protein [Acidimicrobiia bacterium]
MGAGEDSQPQLFDEKVTKSARQDNRLGVALIALGAALLVVAIIGALIVNL